MRKKKGKHKISRCVFEKCRQPLTHAWRKAPTKPDGSKSSIVHRHCMHRIIALKGYKKRDNNTRHKYKERGKFARLPLEMVIA